MCRIFLSERFVLDSFSNAFDVIFYQNPFAATATVTDRRVMELNYVTRIGRNSGIYIR
jgi:hypothetical protein